MTISKTDYLLFRDCPKNAWMKLHRPEIFYASPLSDFEKAIIETGNEVELVARKLFPQGVLIEGRDAASARQTEKLIAQKEEVIFQAVFEKDDLFAAFDVLTYDKKTDSYSVLEIKASNSVKKDWHPYDLAFQVYLARLCGVKVSKACIIHLNSKYIRAGELNVSELFSTTDLTEDVEKLQTEIADTIAIAREYLAREDEPKGCDCIYKTRSNHCATFWHSNPHVPTYGVHDINRISARKLQDLVDSGILELSDVPEDFELSEIQKNQVERAVFERPLIDKVAIGKEFSELVYPLYFLDYETFPSAIPPYDGFSPYQQTPFQYSLHILDSPEVEPTHKEFLFENSSDPSKDFATSLRSHIGDKGTVVVWYKPFESSRNRELAARFPQFSIFLEDINARIYDLRDVFSKQLYVHKDFKGGTSIKDVLPVLVPSLSYKKLAIQEGGTASQKWREMVSDDMFETGRKKIAMDLKEYCKLDTYAMYAIWKHLMENAL